MNEITLLTGEQCFGDDNTEALEIFKKVGTKCAITDFAISLGGFVSDNYINNVRDLSQRSGQYWTKTPYGDNAMQCVDEDGEEYFDNVSECSIGVRPVLPFSFIQSISRIVIKELDEPLEVEYGEWPQTAAPQSLQIELESLYNQNRLQKIGKVYTTFKKPIEGNQAFFLETHVAYELSKKKYIRVKVCSFYNMGSFNDNSFFAGPILFSNGEKYQDDDYVWIEVEPIRWLVFKKENIAISKKILFAGVNFTNLKQFIDQYFSKEIISEIVPSKNYDQSFEKEKSSNTKRKNPYQFTFDKVTEEDIMKEVILSDIATFLHGKSNDGISFKVKQLDPNCEVIYLPTATIESLSVKSFYNPNTGEIIDVPPSWLERVIKRCNEESNKLHIVLFEEITLASEEIQKLAFNIVLNKELSNKFQLPKNCRIVVSGNEITDLKENDLVKLLFPQFAHVYIEMLLEDWVKWAMTPDVSYGKLDYQEKEYPMKIHPAIYAYISNYGFQYLRSICTEESFIANPKKWEMASKVLYQTSNPEMLRALVGKEITKDFCNFCQVQVITFTLKDVLERNYSDQDWQHMNIAQKSACVVELSNCNENELKIVRDFVNNHLGNESITLFDTLWCMKNPSKRKIIEIELDSKNQKSKILRKNTSN